MTGYGDELPPGTRLEEFEIERTLGTGGFGITYLARDRSLDRLVAVKEYLPRDWGTRRADGSIGPRSVSDAKDYQWGLDRFLSEARILAKLEHPHIVRVHRIITAAYGTAYMVMEYVEGRSLREELVAEGTLPETRVRTILAALMDGLKPVHAAGLLHRDIKPGNVMLRAKDGQPVLIDFGAARQVIGQQSRSVTSVLTPGYAPIELYETHGHQGPWTDIYALGAVAYVALTGRLPDDATTRVRNDRLPSLFEAAAQPVSGELAAAVTAALVVNESDRPQTLEAWRAMLAAAGGGEESESARSREERGDPFQEEEWESAGNSGGEPALRGEESTPVREVSEGSRSFREESAPLRVEDVAEDSGPFPAEERSHPSPAGGSSHVEDVSVSSRTEERHAPFVFRWRRYGYGTAAVIVGGFLLVAFLMTADRTGRDDRGIDAGAVTRSGGGATEPDLAELNGGADGTAPMSDPSSSRRADGTAPSGSGEGAAEDDGDAADGDGVTTGTGNSPSVTGGDLDDVAQTAEEELGLDRAARRVVQEGLIAAGFDPGAPDGIFGRSTRTALRRWQVAQGMEETGYLDGAAVEALRATAASPAELVPPPSPDRERITRLETVGNDPDPAVPTSVPSLPDPGGTTRPETADNDSVPTPVAESAGSDPPPPARVETPPPIPDADPLPVPGTVVRDCGDCPEMMVLPSGVFRMGSVGGQGDERPVHRVRVSMFALSRYEVTREEYQAFAADTQRMGSEGCIVVEGDGDLNWDSRASWLDPGFEQEDDHPVVCVGFEDAQAYAQWLGERTGVRYRLPSEAEWEYAARAETVTERYWDGGSTDQCSYANGGDRALLQRSGGWPLPVAVCSDGVAKTANAGSYGPNAFGLYDMLGNVWEWMADCWHEDYQGAPADGSAWRNEGCEGRVWRGGSWDSAPTALRSSNRYRSDDGRPNDVTGFRVARGFDDVDMED